MSVIHKAVSQSVCTYVEEDIAEVLRIGVLGAVVAVWQRNAVAAINCTVPYLISHDLCHVTLGLRPSSEVLT